MHIALLFMHIHQSGSVSNVIHISNEILVKFSLLQLLPYWWKINSSSYKNDVNFLCIIYFFAIKF